MNIEHIVSLTLNELSSPAFVIFGWTILGNISLPELHPDETGFDHPLPPNEEPPPDKNQNEWTTEALEFMRY